MRHSEEVTRKILMSLLESEDYLTLSELSRIMEISKRSVQNYLNKAESWLREHQLSEIQMVKKQGYGTQLDCDAAGRQKLSALLSSQYFTLTDGSMKRRTELLRSLIFSRDELTIQFLADSFYVSRFVILADLDWAENWLAQYHHTTCGSSRYRAGASASLGRRWTAGPLSSAFLTCASTGSRRWRGR